MSSVAKPLLLALVLSAIESPSFEAEPESRAKPVSLEICASASDQDARRGRLSFPPAGSAEATAIFYRARMHAHRGMSDSQIAIWANSGGGPLVIPRFSESARKEVLERCNATQMAAPRSLPVSDSEAIERCYVVALFAPGDDVLEAIARRSKTGEGRLGAITRASMRQSRSDEETTIYLDALGAALKAEPYHVTVEHCRRRFVRRAS